MRVWLNAFVRWIVGTPPVPLSGSSIHIESIHIRRSFLTWQDQIQSWEGFRYSYVRENSWHALESGLFPLSQHPIYTGRVRIVPLVLNPQLLPRRLGLMLLNALIWGCQLICTRIYIYTCERISYGVSSPYTCLPHVSHLFHTHVHIWCSLCALLTTPCMCTHIT